MDKEEWKQYFLDHPQYHSMVSDTEFSDFLEFLSKGALTEDEIFLHYNQDKRALRLLKKGLETSSVGKMRINMEVKYFVTEEAREFLEKVRSIHRRLGAE